MTNLEHWHGPGSGFPPPLTWQQRTVNTIVVCALFGVLLLCAMT